MVDKGQQRLILTVINTTTIALTVIGNGDHLLHTAQRLRNLAKWLRPLLFVTVAVAIVGWLFIIITALREAVFAIDLPFALLALLTLSALALPWLIEQARSDADAFERGYAGEQRTGDFFATHLNGDWTLLRSVTLPGQIGDIDAVLAGPTGVFCLEIKAYGGFVSNQGETWSRRVGDDSWQAIRPNPTEQLETHHADLTRFLHRHDMAIELQPRLVYAGDGVALVENPALPVWDLNRGDEIIGDLVAADHPDPAIVSATIDLLHRHVRQP